MQIKFGTDGWRAIIAREFTTDNVARLAHGTALWLQSQSENHVFLGHDCRFGGPMFADVVARVLCGQGIRVTMATTLVTTPMISLACSKEKSAGIVITASHNAPSFNGFKLKAHYGGPVLPNEISKVEALIPDVAEIPTETLEAFARQGLLVEADLESAYIKEVNAYFNMEAIQQAGLVVAYDAMWGAARLVVPKLIPDVIDLHCGDNPGMNGQQPEPLRNNLKELSSLIQMASDVDFGFANDGDADRIGVLDEHGVFIDAHHTILLLIYYLVKYKDYEGKVILSFSVSDRIKKLCDHLGLEHKVTPIGFKYICNELLIHDSLIGAEESGGIAVKGHIPERDGVWNAMLLLEFMATSGKRMSELIDEIYAITQPFCYQRDDLPLSASEQEAILTRCKNGSYKSFGVYDIVRTESLDGYKFYFSESSWVMIRPSVTEPVLRVYAEANTQAEVDVILEATHKALSES